MKHYILIFVLALLSSCSGLQDVLSKKLPNIQADLDDISHFFDTKKVNPTNFGDLNLMLFDSDDYPEFSVEKPFMYYAMDSITLGNSVLVKQDFFSMLILDCPFENSVGLFYKQNSQKSIQLIEHTYFPDNIELNVLNDTLLVCQLYWKENFGSAKSDMRKYYFFGEKTGMFKYGYMSVGSKLKLDYFSTTEEGILLDDKVSSTSLVIFPDTLKQFDSSKTSKNEIFKPNFTHFNKASLGERP